MVVRCVLNVVGWLLLNVSRLGSVVCCAVFLACCSLCVLCWFLFDVACLAIVFGRVVLVACWLLMVVCRSVCRL